MNPFFLILGLLLPISAFSSYDDGGSGRDGHGGSAVFCQNERPRLLEFYEAPSLDSQDDAPITIQLRRRLEALNPIDRRLGVELLSLALDIQNRARPLDPFFTHFRTPLRFSGMNHDWKFTDDTGPVVLPASCELRTIVFYFDSPDMIAESDVVLYDPFAYLGLRSSEKAALWLHEAIYKKVRQSHPDSDTVPVRRLVQALFAPRLDERALRQLLAICFY